eukprot:3940370-Rhodomonas_salina.2
MLLPAASRRASAFGNTPRLATRCPVLTYCMLLSPCAVSGTDLAYPDIVLCACYAMSVTHVPYGAISAYARAMRCA